MPPRSSKGRGGSQRWLVVPFVLTLVVLLVDASMHARSNRPAATLDSQAWVDKVLPAIAQSSAQGNELAQVSSGTIAAGGSSAVAGEVSGIATATVSTYKTVLADVAPSEVARSAGLLQACLSARQQGAAEMSSAVKDLLGGDGPTSAAAQMMMSAAADFRVSDSAYQLFTEDLPKLGVAVPASAWTAAAGSYQATELTAFANRLLGGVTRSEPHKLHIDAITTDPPALRVQGNLQVLSPATMVSVTAVVADLGQSAEQGVKVSATISPAHGAPSQQVTVSVNLSPGEAQAVTLTGLHLVPSTPTNLTIGALEPGGEPGTAYKSVTVEVPGPNFAGITTTTVPGPTTTTT